MPEQRPPRVRGSAARRFKKLLILGLLAWPVAVWALGYLLEPGEKLSRWHPVPLEILGPSLACSIIGALVLIPAWRWSLSRRSRLTEDLLINWSVMVCGVSLVLGASTFPAYALLAPSPVALVALIWLGARHGSK